MLEGTTDKASVGFGAESQSSEHTPTCVHQQDHPKDFFLTALISAPLPSHFAPYFIFFGENHQRQLQAKQNPAEAPLPARA